MSGLDAFFWRSTLDWPALIRGAEGVVARWNGVTRFVTQTDQRERIWTVRHHSSGLPFMVFNEGSLRGSVPRIGNPLPFLLLLGISRARPGSVDLSFSNGQKIDPARFELADLTGLLPHATHAAHRKLAELAIAPLPPA